MQSCSTKSVRRGRAGARSSASSCILQSCSKIRVQGHRRCRSESQAVLLPRRSTRCGIRIDNLVSFSQQPRRTQSRNQDQCDDVAVLYAWPPGLDDLPCMLQLWEMDFGSSSSYGPRKIVGPVQSSIWLLTIDLGWYDRWHMVGQTARPANLDSKLNYIDSLVFFSWKGNFLF